MLSRKHKWLALLLTMIMMIGLIPAVSIAQVGDPEPNYGFIPNSGEASVSKVDLVNMEEVARYYTAPRIGENIDLVGNETTISNTIPPYNWRTSRIAMDADGNAWVLNTGADGTNLQGSVVRIQADTNGLTTHAYPDPVLTFGADEAVQVFPVGSPGEMPRAIAIDSDGYIWIGFYSGSYLMKYEYDDVNETLTAVGGPFTPINQTSPITATLRYYEMKFDPEGTLFISSRGSTPTRAGNYGVWSFDPNAETFTSEWVVNSPYALLIDPVSGQVYATSYGTSLWIHGTGTVAISGAENLRGMSFDESGEIIWIASTRNTSEGDRVCWYNTANGESGWITGFSTTPVGLGLDEQGLMWVVCRSDNTTNTEGFIRAFDPATQPRTAGAGIAHVSAGNIQVGYRPYSYGDFVVPQIPELYKICGFKFNDDTDAPINGWTIQLEKLEAPDTWVTVGDMLTGSGELEDGQYCFTDLPAGTYRVSEEHQAGWEQTFPEGDGTHVVTLPSGNLNPIPNGNFEAGNTGFGSDYDYVSVAAQDPGLGTMEPEQTYAIGTDPRLYHELWTSFVDHTEGDVNNYMMIVNGADEVEDQRVWYATAVVDSKTDYTFSFWGATSYPDAFATLDVYINEVMVGTYQAPSAVAEWTKFSVAWNSGDAEAADIKLICNTLIHTGTDFALDDISLSKDNYNFRNAMLSDICGYKYLAGTEQGLAGWTIELFKWDPALNFGEGGYPEVADQTAVTDEFGKYCFEDLSAGVYKISESYGEMNNDDFWKTPDGKYWRPIDPETGVFELTLPEEKSDCIEGPFHNFYNQCYTGETAWAFGDIALNTLPGLTANNWGWSITLGTLSGEARTLEENVPIYAGAGQNDVTKGYLIGYVDIIWTGTAVDWVIDYEDGVVANTPKVFIGNTVLPLDKNGNFTNAPGKLIINVDYTKPAYMAMHWDTYVPCGFPNAEAIVAE